MWNRGRLTEACRAVHELRYFSEVTSPHEGFEESSEENGVTEVRSAVAEWCAAHPRPKDHVQAEQQVKNLESHVVKCLFADQPRRQNKGNIQHALTAETLQLVREKQIFLSKLPSDRPLTEMESEQRKFVIKKGEDEHPLR